jgi:putative SOS response-associated peptidase YedK
MDGIHDRMPVILDPATFDVWLDPDLHDLGELTALVRAVPSGTITHHPVSPRVGNVRNNDASLVTPIPPGSDPNVPLFEST